jgi:hypothetical protein
LLHTCLKDVFLQADLFVVQNSMTEFLLKRVVIQKLLDPPRDYRLLQNLVDGQSFPHIQLEHLGNKRLELSGKLRWQRWILSPHNLKAQKVHTRTLEGRPERA